VLQFGLLLEGSQPLIWRQIQVPADFTLARLHGVIQAVMGWQDYHLHEFTIAGRTYSVPDPESEFEAIDERTVRLRDFNLSPGDRIGYQYDFGDDWQHVLELEEVLASDTDDLRPHCLAGERSTPPEDVGGISGYEEFLEALRDPNHEEHDHMKGWVGRQFDPTEFSVEEANARLEKRFRRRKVVRKRESSAS
jgi:hypothetical protein